MTPLADITLENRGGVVVAALSGEVDASNASDLGDRIREGLTNEATALVVDLAETSYIDSAGLNVLFQLNVELRARQQALGVVVEAGSAVERTLSIVGMGTAVGVHHSQSAALEDLSPG